MLQNYLMRIDVVDEKIKTLLMTYRQILKVKSVECSKQPRPTAIFLSVPQYNRIFTCILKWFSKVGYEFERETSLFNFTNAPSVYETYVLIRLVKQIEALGFKLCAPPKELYCENFDTGYQRKAYKNVYYFTDDEQFIALYYEPVILDVAEPFANAISIYRNNTTSLHGQNDVVKHGHYYTPDYLLKAVINGEERYIICDAKYSRLKKVRSQLLPELAYKYLFSLSPFRENVSILGLDVFLE